MRLPTLPTNDSDACASSKVASIHTLGGGTPAEQQQLATQLKGAEESLCRAASGGGVPLAEALAALDHAQHTLAFIYCLCVPRAPLSSQATSNKGFWRRSDAQGAAAGTSTPALEAFIGATCRFMLAANEAQIKLVPEKCAPPNFSSCPSRAP